jgi:hypothetical protein
MLLTDEEAEAIIRMRRDKREAALRLNPKYPRCKSVRAGFQCGAVSKDDSGYCGHHRPKLKA